MSRCDPGLAKKDSHPIHGASGSQPSRNFGAHPPSRCLVALAVVSLFLLSSLLVSEFHGLYHLAELLLSVSLSRESLGCSLCLYLVDLVCHGDLDMSLVLLENLLAAAAATCGYYSPTTTTTKTTTTTATYCYCYSFSSCCC